MRNSTTFALNPSNSTGLGCRLGPTYLPRLRKSGATRPSAIGIFSKAGRKGRTFAHWDISRRRESLTCAGEADALNVALFGVTAKEWRQTHPDSPGNIRDEASLQQLIVWANLESINAELIRQGVPQSERLLRLNASAKQMMNSLVRDHRIEMLDGTD